MRFAFAIYHIREFSAFASYQELQFLDFWKIKLNHNFDVVRFYHILRNELADLCSEHRESSHSYL